MYATSEPAPKLARSFRTRIPLLILVLLAGAFAARPTRAQTYEVLHHFDNQAHPRSALIQDASGNLYGTTVTGGAGGYGTVFKLEPSGRLITLHSFNGEDGASPYASLIRDEEGNLYGTTVGIPYASPSFGTVFKLDPYGRLTTLHTFPNDYPPTGPQYPFASLIRDDEGNLYGTSVAGGTDFGTIFKIDPSGSLTILHVFDGSDGTAPYSALIRDSSGNLYGTTSAGGADGNWGPGTIFKLDPSGRLTTLHSFTGTDGLTPYAALTRDDSGNLYGTTFGEGLGSSACGTIFKLDPSGTLTTLHGFSGPDGNGPYASLILNAGNLYGTTVYGGPNGYGTVFRLDTSGTLTTLNGFDGADGSGPYGALILDASGNLYGTSSGEADGTGSGTIFKLDPSGTLSTLHRFEGEGAAPSASLIQDEAGNLYGTTLVGGVSGYGTVFKIDTSGTLTTLHSFTGIEGSTHAALIRDGSGALYGTTSGGSWGRGAIFELDPSGTLTTLYSFDGSDGEDPRAALIQDSSGDFYGTTAYGGANNSWGTVFKFDSSGLTTLHKFSYIDGAHPFASLIQDDSGNLYGTTLWGGASEWGTIFKLEPSGTLQSFDIGVGGFGPDSALLLDISGNLYGTSSGGAGTVFRLDTTGTVTALHTFGFFDGAAPHSGLIQDASGNLYGTTSERGTPSGGAGTIFRLDSANTLTTLHVFNGLGGAKPLAGLISDASGNFYGTAAQGGLGGGGIAYRFSTVTAPLTVSAIVPSSGPASGGMLATAEGTGFLPGATLAIAGAGTSNTINVDSTAIQAVSPELLPGTLGDVTVSSPGSSPGSSTATLVNGFFVDFLDLTPNNIFHDYVETIVRHGITAGCGGGYYCGNNAVRRDQMAAFLLKAEHGSGYVPPACEGMFSDVSCPSMFADWIEQLFHEGITGGCGGGNYCPNNPVTRAQMSAFLLKAEHGSSYVPPACKGTFADVTCPSLFADWIEQLAVEQITGGCGGGNYCPNNPSTRGQMAAFLVKTFGLVLYGP